jgi:hypothetical protein
MNLEAISIVVGVLLALTGYVVTYLINLRIAQRADRLKYVNKQLEEFYGPLYVMSRTGRVLFDAFEYKRKSSHTLDLEQEWITWLDNVFIPLNIKMEEILINKAYLIREEKMPDPLLLFCAHSAGYRVIKQKWLKNDYSESNSLIPFPEGLEDYAKKSYTELKKEQLKLMGPQKEKITQRR